MNPLHLIFYIYLFQNFLKKKTTKNNDENNITMTRKQQKPIRIQSKPNG